MQITIIGGIPPPTTGQRINNKKIKKILENNGDNVQVINLPFFSRSKLFDLRYIITFVVNEAKLILSSNRQIFKAEIIYMPIHQSYLGFIRYMIYIIQILLLKKPYIIRIEGSTIVGTYQNSNILFRWIYDYIFKNSFKIAHLSDFTMSKIPFSELSNNIQFSNTHGISNDFFRANKNEVTKILFLSTISENKGIFELFEACLLLSRENIDFKLTIAGTITGNIHEKFNYYLTKLKGKVAFVGLVKGSKKINLLCSSDIFVLPSKLEEGQPISILEAMATGNAIIASRVGGIADIIKNSINGYLIPKNNKIELKNSLVSLIENPSDLLKIKINNINISKKYSTQNFENNVLSLFKQN